MGKRKRKNSVVNKEEEKDVSGEPTESKRDYVFSDQLLSEKKEKWINRQRVMILANRGISARDRHLMTDLKNMLVHSKSESKLDSDKKELFNDVSEICEARNCSKCILFVNKKRKDTYLWFTSLPDGPSIKFFVENIHTMAELNMIGNCLKGSRPLLSFDPKFDSQPHLQVVKEIFVQTFGIPNYHPKSQPFFDKVYTFTILDDRIWFRNYQLISEEGRLEEVGPRFVLSLVKIFEANFAGTIIYSNPNFINPNLRRRMVRQQAFTKFKDKIIVREGREAKRPRGEEYQDVDPLGSVFETIPPEQAKGIDKQVFRRAVNAN